MAFHHPKFLKIGLRHNQDKSISHRVAQAD
jgi:hypothetical protein